MRALLVTALTALAAATASGHGQFVEAVSAGVGEGSPTESIVLLLSGSALIGLAGALKRLTV